MKCLFLYFALFMLVNNQQLAWRPPMAPLYPTTMGYVQGLPPRWYGSQVPVFNRESYYPWKSQPQIVDQTNQMLFRSTSTQTDPGSSWNRLFGETNPFAGPDPSVNGRTDAGVNTGSYTEPTPDVDTGSYTEPTPDINTGSYTEPTPDVDTDLNVGSFARPYSNSYAYPYDVASYPGMQPFYLPFGLKSFYTPDLDLPKFLSLKSTTPYQDTCEFQPKHKTPKCVCGVDKTHRIFGGEEANSKAHPWMAAIYHSSSELPICGATIISRSWVLTAAHCFKFPSRLKKNNLVVRVGEHRVFRKDVQEKEFKVSQVIAHEEFQRSTGRNDIALVKLNQPIKFSFFVSPVCLPFRFRNCTWEGYDILVAGWGNTESKEPSPILRETNIPVISLKKCQERFPIVNELSLCANAKGKDTCKGDSGGPALIYLTAHVFIAGVVSWGIGCGISGTPGVYTNVAKYIDWIEENTDASFCRP